MKTSPLSVSAACLAAVVGIAVFAGLAFAAPDGGEPQSSTSNSFITEPSFDPKPANLVITDSHFHLVVTIQPDGSVEIAKGVSMNKATRTFWEAIEYANPLRAEVARLKRENRDLRRRCR